jgi:hypothetical protein
MVRMPGQRQTDGDGFRAVQAEPLKLEDGGGHSGGAGRQIDHIDPTNGVIATP